MVHVTHVTRYQGHRKRGIYIVDIHIELLTVNCDDQYLSPSSPNQIGTMWIFKFDKKKQNQRKETKIEEILVKSKMPSIFISISSDDLTVLKNFISYFIIRLKF